MTTWMIGDVSVTRVEEQVGFASLPPEKFIAGLDRAMLDEHRGWLIPNHYDPQADRIITSIHSWLIRTKHHTILLDCCGGNHKDRPGFKRFHQLDTPFLARLRAAGAMPEDIDIVLCTHLHNDHVGWNTVRKDGEWVPTFPNAKYLISRAENDYGDPRRNPKAEADLQRNNAYRDSVLPVIEHGQAQLIDGAHAIEDGLLIEAAQGHTVGHIILNLANGGDRALLCGDALHHPLQVYAPHLNSGFCEMQDEARLTRARVLGYCAEERALLMPAHFAAPHVAMIHRHGDSFLPEFVEGPA